MKKIQKAKIDDEEEEIKFQKSLSFFLWKFRL